MNAHGRDQPPLTTKPTSRPTAKPLPRPARTRPFAAAAFVLTLGCLTSLATTAAADTPAPNPTAQPSSAPAPAPTLAPAKPATSELREAILFTKDGRVFTGMLLVQDPERYVLDIAGVETTFAATLIDRVRLLAPVLDRYKEMRETVPADDVERRAELVIWLADRRQAELALLEAEVLLARNPKSVSAKRLLDQVRTKADLLRPDPQALPATTPLTTPPAKPRSPGTAESSTDPATALEPEPQPESSTDPTDATPRVADFPVLNSKQINLVKVFEVDLTQNPRLIIPQQVIRDLIEQYTASPLIPATRSGRDELLRRPPTEVLDLIYRLKARDFYERVQVLDHPASMRRFRDDVHRTFILNACATSGCHASPEAGRFVLATFRPNSDPTLYTNFYILQQFRTVAGESLLNFDHPERSVLIQYALPRDIARQRHPQVLRDGRDHWRPALSGPEDRRLQATVDWLKTLYRPRPDYEMDYEPFRPFVAPQPVIPDPKAPAAPKVER